MGGALGGSWWLREWLGGYVERTGKRNASIKASRRLRVESNQLPIGLFHDQKAEKRKDT